MKLSITYEVRRFAMKILGSFWEYINRSMAPAGTISEQEVLLRDAMCSSSDG